MVLFSFSALSSMGLPGAIEAIENPFTLPQSLVEKMRIVQSEGGLKMIEDQIKLLERMSQQTDSILNEALTILDQEEQEDNQMRTKYKDKWTR
jgi:programmed cell death 6-interacting protein